MILGVTVQIAELVSAVGVIASLVYLAIQIRRNESTTRAGTTQELLSKSIDMLLSQDENSPLYKLQSGQVLSGADKIKLEQLYFARFSHFNNAQHQNSVGKLDPEIWAMYDARTRRNIQQIEDFDDWWEKYQDNFTQSFKDYVVSIRKQLAG